MRYIIQFSRIPLHKLFEKFFWGEEPFVCHEHTIWKKWLCGWILHIFTCSKKKNQVNILIHHISHKTQQNQKGTNALLHRAFKLLSATFCLTYFISFCWIIGRMRICNEKCPWSGRTHFSSKIKGEIFKINHIHLWPNSFKSSSYSISNDVNSATKGCFVQSRIQCASVPIISRLFARELIGTQGGKWGRQMTGRSWLKKLSSVVPKFPLIIASWYA